MKHHYLLLLTLSTSVLFFPMQALAMKKCQDAEGNWHYGNTSTAVCADSDVTTMNDRGFITEIESAPKSTEELQAEEQALAAVEAEKLRIETEENEKTRILSIYETEEDIDRQRDNQLNSVDGNIKVHEAYLKSMDTRIERFERQLSEATRERVKENLQNEIGAAKARVEKSSLELSNLKQQRDNIVEKFKNEKDIYLALKNQD